MGVPGIVCVCVGAHLVAGQLAWPLHLWWKERRWEWLTVPGMREAIEDRLPDGMSGLPLAVFLWVLMSVAWPFPLGVTLAEDLRERRERERERLRPSERRPGSTGSTGRTR